MTLDRRSFLRRTSLALAGGLVLGDAALEMFERLTHRKVFALGAVPEKWVHYIDVPDPEKALSFKMYMDREIKRSFERTVRDFIDERWAPTYGGHRWPHGIIGI